MIQSGEVHVLRPDAEIHAGTPPDSELVHEGQAILAAVLDGRQPQSLSELRAVVDELDFTVMALAAARLEATRLISGHKASQSLPAVDVGRERVILSDAGRRAKLLGLESGAVTGFFRGLIDAARYQHNVARSNLAEQSA